MFKKRKKNLGSPNFNNDIPALAELVKKNTEYQAMLGSIAMLKKSISDLETSQLELMEMLEKDIQAAHIYESVVADKFGQEFKNEFQRQLVIV